MSPYKIPVVFLLLLLNASLTTLAQPKILLGIDVITQHKFAELQGKRVGLLTHQAGKNRQGRSTIDILHQARNVNLVALYSPEHGIDGAAKANEHVTHGTHPRTRLPVYSLYGRTRKPTPQMLRGIDTLIVDLQDIGTRSYTYISCMRLAMEACFENNVSVIILDRPNPLGGIKVDGPPMDEQWRSYVGTFQMPYVHGLTIGEIANMAKATPGWLNLTNSVRQNGRLKVIPMQGWHRRMLWSDTGLPWIATSPNIPDLSAVLGYPMTGLGAQIGGFKHGIGSPYPFRMLTFPGMSIDTLHRRLRQANIPGITFEKRSFIQGNGKQDVGLYTTVTDYMSLRPTELSFHMMKISAEFHSYNPFAAVSKSEAGLFNKHVGSQGFWNALIRDGKNIDVNSFIIKWQKQAHQFRMSSKLFWLYP